MAIPNVLYQSSRNNPLVCKVLLLLISLYDNDMALFTHKTAILAVSNTFVEIDHEIIPTVILLPSAYSRRVVVSNKRKYVHEVLVNCLVKLTQEKSVVR